VWRVARWPIALVLMVAAIAVVFHRAPNRHQPGWSWLAYGSTISVLGWTVASVGLGLFFRWSSSFGDTYGPLAGLLALLLWALLSAMTILLGGAVAAQLEAIRRGVDEPRDEAKVAESEPRSQVLSNAGR